MEIKMIKLDIIILTVVVVVVVFVVTFDDILR